MRDSYGRESFGQGCLLARRLVEHGVRHVEVSFGNWDTHNANFIRVPELCEELDAALSTLLQDLESRGLLKRDAGRAGHRVRPHPGDQSTTTVATTIPKAFTCLMAGGGIRGGQAYGKKDEKGFEVAENKVEIPDFNATIAYALGLPLDQVLYSPSKRPFTVADKGKPITPLFG